MWTLVINQKIATNAQINNEQELFVHSWQPSTIRAFVAAKHHPCIRGNKNHSCIRGSKNHSCIRGSKNHSCIRIIRAFVAAKIIRAFVAAKIIRAFVATILMILKNAMSLVPKDL